MNTKTTPDGSIRRSIYDLLVELARAYEAGTTRWQALNDAQSHELARLQLELEQLADERRLERQAMETRIESLERLLAVLVAERGERK